MKRKFNSKGSLNFFGENTAGIVIGVVCFVILIFAAVVGYGFFQDQSDLQKAESYIGAIKSSVESSKDSLNHESVANIFGPTDWWIIAWPYKNQIEKPYSCKGFTACICICATGVGVADSLNQCNNLGRCVGVDSNIKTTYNKSPPAWYSKAIKNTVDFFGGDTTNIPIPIDKPPIAVKIKYDKDKGYEVIAE